MLSHTTSVVPENGKSAHRQAGIANTVPVPVVVSRKSPPCEPNRRVGITLDSPLESETEDGVFDLFALSRRPVIVEPVIADSKSGREFGDVEEMLRIPVVSRISEWVTRISSGILQTTDVVRYVCGHRTFGHT